MSREMQSQQSHKLIRYGILLFLLGLITGFVIPAMENPRVGLSSHLEGVMNGMFLVLIGLIWTRLKLTGKAPVWGYGLALYGTYANWFTIFLAGLWGAGAEMMPIAGGGYTGLAWQEALIKFGLISLSLAMLAVCGLILWGLRGSAEN